MDEIKSEIKPLADLLNAHFEHAQILIQFFLTCPFAAWVKIYRDSKLYMVRTNPAYEKYFGITVNAYSNKQDQEIWGSDTGENFNKNDVAAIKRMGSSIVKPETFFNSKTEQKETWEVVKWAFSFNDKIYIFGVAREKL